MKTEVDNYRGYEIRFDSDNETFECDIDDSRSVKKSYSAVKKFLDDFIKDNSEFKPFKIECIPNRYNGKKGVIEVIGIRKDGRFIIKNGDKQEQLSSYDIEKYMLFNPDNSTYWHELKECESQIDKIREIIKQIEAKFKIVTLKSVTDNYIIK